MASGFLAARTLTLKLYAARRRSDAASRDPYLVGCTAPDCPLFEIVEGRTNPTSGSSPFAPPSEA